MVPHVGSNEAGVQLPSIWCLSHCHIVWDVLVDGNWTWRRSQRWNVFKTKTTTTWLNENHCRHTVILFVMLPYQPCVSCFVRSLMLAVCFLFWVTSSSLSSSTRMLSRATSVCSAVRSSCRPCTSCCLSSSSCLSCRDWRLNGDRGNIDLIP